MAKSTKEKRKCFCCEKEYVDTNYYRSYSNFFSNIGKVPYCKQCIEKFYQQYYEKYVNEGCLTPEQNAVKRLCMAFDIFYSEKAYNSAINDKKNRNINISPMGAYMKMIQLSQHKDKSYDNTFADEEKEEFINGSISRLSENSNIDEKTKQFFGRGFSDEDYEYLKREYDDWVARHECKTKVQEEIFKGLCFTQLRRLKAERRGEDTKDLEATFLKQLEAAKLQPKQNSGDTTADNQTFGTLIDKWENERPLPEIDEELKDVDNIGLYIDTFFKGHTCKMLGEKNAFSNLYSSMMEKFTVNKPEYESDDEYDSEMAFDKRFGKLLADSDDELG